MDKIDILMLAYNHWNLTIKALDSLMESTDYNDFRLIFINNGSFDDTTSNFYKWLNNHPELEYKFVNYNENKGWIKAIHDAYPLIDKKYFLTCHNDVEFEKDWLPKMLKRFEDDDKIAMVGPTSDFILGLQNLQFNGPGIVSENAKFICGLFCLFKKEAVDELIDKDGYFMDEVFGLGDKEEIDYAVRLTDLGYKFRIARNVFIKHHGEKGFVDKLGSQKAFHDYQNKNYEILLDKWGQKRIEDIYKSDLSKRVNVVICTPLRNNYNHYKFTASMLSMRKVPTVQFMNSVRYIIHEARNALVQKALELEATHICFVDDDMIVPEEGLIKLLEHDVDIVCGLAFRRLPPYDPCIFKVVENKDIYPIESINNGLIDIDGCGSAFILIKTNVFKKMPQPWYVWGDKSLGIYVDKGGLGEDISFTMRAKRMGFRVCCDTDLIVQHIGEEQIVDDKVYIEHKDKNGIQTGQISEPVCA
jgi:GT2 family glycosyltransferase